MVNLGNACCTGAAGERDDQKAKAWFEKAASMGAVHGEFALGVMCKNGDGAPQDLGMARPLLEDACAKGRANARAEAGALPR